jgi:aspartyl-tRNA(Asn)/glutamyl-tRNA(Gln) amidotransferase subunit B
VVEHASHGQSSLGNELDDRLGLRQISDSDALGRIVGEVIAANPDAVADVRAGKAQAIGFLVGQVMKASGGKANPAAVNELLKKKLAG